jgi:hypothetical protein
MLLFWKHRIPEKMKDILIESVYKSEKELLKYDIHIESFSFEITRELKKLFSYASRFKNFMYIYYGLLIPINSDEFLNFVSIFYSKNYVFKPKDNPALYYSKIEIQDRYLSKPKLFVGLKFDVYTYNVTLDEDLIKNISPSVEILKVKDRVELILYDLPIKIEHKVFYI